MFNQFYVRIEEIQGNYFKTENIEPIKHDVMSYDTTTFITNEDSQFYGNSAVDGFDNVSIENDFFGNDDGKNLISTRMTFLNI